MISIIVVGQNFYEVIKQMNAVFKFLVKLAGPVNVNYGETTLESRNDHISLPDIYGRFR